MLLIPAIDLKEGQCVRLRQGRMDDSTVFSNSPVDMARQWINAGSRRLHLVDLDGAFAGKPENREVIKEIAKTFPDMEIQVGGGIRDADTIEDYISNGINYVIVGTKAINDPGFLKQICKDYRGHVILGLDAKEGLLALDGWANLSDKSAITFAKEVASYGIEAIVFTDIARDGMMQGFNADATAALARETSIPVIASGGMTNLDDVKRLCTVAQDGVMGAIIGRAIYEGTINLTEAQTLADELTGED